jgi:NAD(P)H-dependent FMN reductase
VDRLQMKIIAVCGSLRAQSSNLALLHAAAAIAPEVEIYEGVAALPHFNPDDDVEGAVPSPAVAAFARCSATPTASSSPRPSTRTASPAR